MADESRYWPDPGQIQTALATLELQSATLINTRPVEAEWLGTAHDTTTAHLTDDDTVAIVNDPGNRDLDTNIRDALPCNSEPYLRIPVDDVEADLDQEALPDGWNVMSMPYKDEYLKIRGETDEEPEDMRWVSNDEA